MCPATSKMSPSPFRTIVDFSPNSLRIDHDRAVLLVGSCFSEHIGSRLGDFRFRLCSNPTGVLYNPLSIVKAIHRVLEGREYTQEEMFHDRGQWKSFDHHSRFNASTVEKCLDRANNSLRRAGGALDSLGTLILTFGTAFVYRLASDERVVANCHRLPHTNFTRSLAGVGEIVTSCRELLSILYERDANLNVIFTVSPVRHLRDSPHENQVSKSHLITAVYELERLFPNAYYFPSYEIMMDELRDYRFYDSDMVHPSSVAIDYLWERFTESCISPRGIRFIKAYAPILKACEHRIQDLDSESTRSFAKGQLDRIDRLNNEFPEVSLRNDRIYFESLASAGPGEVSG
ncbi:MAG: GSCFA domain protein [Chitinivibrionales bacterium]|nr:GSCFA domain protein [Chitinivibrionales bacterium]MBD3357210.1 GSCFA domain protein [Chitinivibrionales bacterium]